jgi:hypothetical protein
LLRIVNPIFSSFSNIANAPPVFSGTQECQSNASTMLKKDIDGAIDDFMMALDSIAVKHAQ